MTREFTLIRIDKLLEPADAARTEIDPELLDSLTESIREIGVKEPLLVISRDGGQFEVVAGHRRLLASRRAGLIEVPCIIETDPEEVEAIRIHENIEREELHPADEAMFLSKVYVRCGEDVDKVAAVVRKTRDYVERRLNLLRGSPKVFEALADKRINMGVAEELNRMKRAEDADWYLEHAVKAGASIRLMRQWRMEANARAELDDEQRAKAAAASTRTGTQEVIPPPSPSFDAARAPWELSSSRERRPCMFCGDEHEEWKMYRRFLCRPCAEKWEEEKRREGA